MISLPARKFKLGKWEGFAELVLDDEGEAKTEDEVGEGEVEDEDVPGRPHLLVPQHSGHDYRVAHNCNLEFFCRLLFMLLSNVIPATVERMA